MIRAALLYSALTFVLAFPLTIHPATTVLSDSPDQRLVIWSLAWDTHAFTHRPLRIFDANIYYPNRRTLAYSESFIGSGLIAAPVIWTTGNLVLAANVVTLLSPVLCGLGTFLLARKLGLSEGGALVAGTVFAFAPARFLRLDQLHLTTVQWVPFALAYLHAYLDGHRPRDLHCFVGFVTLQALTSGHGFVFLAVSALLVVVWRLLLGEPIEPLRRVRDFGFVGVLLLVPLAYLAINYGIVQREVGLRRSLENWSVNGASFLASPTRVDAWLLRQLGMERVNATADAYLFPGVSSVVLAAVGAAPLLWSSLWLDVIVAIAIGAAAFVTWVRPIRVKLGSMMISARSVTTAWVVAAAAIALRLALARSSLVESWRDRRHRWTTDRRTDPSPPYILVALLGFWLALGSPLGLWPFVYDLPLLNFIRVPSRFILMATLGLAVLAGIGFDRVLAAFGARDARTFTRSAAIYTAIAVVALVAEYAAMPMDTTPFSIEIPAIDRWIAERPGIRAIAEVPIDNRSDERRHTLFMLHATAHWRPTVEGYSGLRTPMHEDLYAKLVSFPDEASLRSLLQLGVSHVVVHEDLVPPDALDGFNEKLRAFARWLTPVQRIGNGAVYSVHAPTETAQ
jgi:hypothetical protein